MKKIGFYFMVLVIALSTGCNSGNQNNSQQIPAQGGEMPAGGFGPGGGGMGGNFDPAAMVDRQIEQMKETLTLTTEQETKLREVLQQNSAEMQNMMQNMQGGGGMEGMREQMQQMREKQNEKMKSVLTDEQWETYQAQQAEMGSRRGQGGFGGPR
ncbi:MAG: hypothetical protein JXR61_10435 [Prolixibacteraceae bacterium]|nr:hypothetical protein [Prolixibacteraceae bacterium]